MSQFRFYFTLATFLSNSGAISFKAEKPDESARDTFDWMVPFRIITTRWRTSDCYNFRRSFECFILFDLDF
jgi:hypothetical protein